MRELVQLTSSWLPARVKGGSDGPFPDPFVAPTLPMVPTLVELSLEIDPSTFVHRHSGAEPYLSKPVCPPFKLNTLTSRGFVFTKH